MNEKTRERERGSTHTKAVCTSVTQPWCDRSIEGEVRLEEETNKERILREKREGENKTLASAFLYVSVVEMGGGGAGERMGGDNKWGEIN